MKKTRLILSLILIFAVSNAMAQTTEELLQLLVKKKMISNEEADSVRAASLLKDKSENEKQKNFVLKVRNSIQLSGYTQVRFQSFQESGKKDNADIRRARLDFRGNITPEWDYRLQFDLAAQPKLLDAFAAFKPFSFLKIQAGQFKLPFSMENLTPSNNLETIDRSQAVEAFIARGKDVVGNQNGRDIGLQISGSLLKFRERFLLDYFLGGFNGNGINTTDNNEAKDVVARILLHPAAGLDVGASWYNGYDSYMIPPVSHIRTRIGSEISYIYKFASIKGEYIMGEDGGVDKSGYYTQLSFYFFKKKTQLVVRYDNFDPDMDKKDDQITNYLGGINYFFNDFTRLQLNYTYRDEEAASINNDLISVQLQIAF